VRLYARFKHRSPPDAYEVYLKTTIVNLARSHGRKRSREQAWLSRQASTKTAETMPDLSQQDEMWGALLNLPVRQRAAVFLRYYEDLSYDQIGRVLQCSIGAVKSLLLRGLRTLRADIGGESDG
jgi:RNA polymerase sigma factor (sigma-70 family)